MKIAICDDEREVGEQIKDFIRRQKGGCKVELYGSGEELLAAEVPFDMIFLDIQMGGMDGISTARELRRRNADTVLIFITGIREAVFDAFDVSAFHYLLKPVNERKFAEVFRRAEEVCRRRGQEPLVIRTGGKSLTLERKDILYLESRGRKAEIHRKANPAETIEIYANMDELEEQLGENFYRCHRGYLVNLAYIREYDRESIRLANGESIYLSRRKYDEFVKAYMHYLRRRRGWDG